MSNRAPMPPPMRAVAPRIPPTSQTHPSAVKRHVILMGAIYLLNDRRYRLLLAEIAAGRDAYVFLTKNATRLGELDENITDMEPADARNALAAMS